jgi:jumonji domain-containing protein 2
MDPTTPTSSNNGHPAGFDTFWTASAQLQERQLSDNLSIPSPFAPSCSVDAGHHDMQPMNHQAAFQLQQPIIGTTMTTPGQGASYMANNTSPNLLSRHHVSSIHGMFGHPSAAAPILSPANEAAHTSDAPIPIVLEPPPTSPLSSTASTPAADDSSTGTDDVFSRHVASVTPGLESPVSSPASIPRADDFQVEYDLDAPEGREEGPVYRLKPTASQWEDFPSILSFAYSLGAANDGCFKVVSPDHLQEAVADIRPHVFAGNAYKIRQIKRNGFWQVHTVPSEGKFEAPSPSPQPTETVDTELKKLKKMFNKNKDKQIRGIRYRVDVPAWTKAQREEAGIPEQSPIHPLKGDKLDRTLAIIPGIHTPYVYEANDHFGATFQIHAEDYRLVSLNHLYKGRKIWIVIPSTAVDAAEEAFGRKKKCSQFMRHRAEFFFPEKLDKMNIPYRIVDQRPGETIVILPDAYHQGFSTGYTLAEAKNYAEMSWSTDKYQACSASCKLMTAIPEAFMAPLKEGETRLDLCANYGSASASRPPKREAEEEPIETAVPAQQETAKRVKLE